jgi:hypothetical protein
MRRILLFGLVTLFAALPAVPGVASAATTLPAPPPAIGQFQTGAAFGTVGTLLSEPGSQTDTGRYATTGQLGTGTYRFDETFHEECLHGVASISTHGTARLTRSDGAVLTGNTTFIERCSTGTDATAIVVVNLNQGSRELLGGQLMFLGRMSFLATPSGTVGPEAFAVSGSSSATTRVGYWMVDSSGSVYAFGGVDRLGDAPTLSATHIEPTASRGGYWIVDASGRVFAFGDAHWFGNASGLDFGEHVTSLSATTSGHGYWLFTDRGRVLPFGDAKFYGDLNGVTLNGGVIGSSVTPSGHGYYLVARDGGVFTFGDANFRGSMGATHLNQPVIGLVPTVDNRGYWLVASDGGVFTFGDATFRGSMGAVPLSKPVVALVRYGTGYLMVGQDGGIFDFSPALFYGSLGGAPIPQPIVSGAAAG